MIRPHPVSSLFPYTPLFRSAACRWTLRQLSGYALSLLPLSHPPPVNLYPHRRAIQCEDILIGILLRHLQGRLGCAFRSEEHTSELQSLTNLVCRLLLEKKKK